MLLKRNSENPAKSGDPVRCELDGSEKRIGEIITHGAEFEWARQVIAKLKSVADIK